jgi:putative peptide zinc metalloprotease protein
VFPFSRPLPPGEGDNQALAVNTADGSTVYDVAFALVWADGDSVLNTNEAYALASCTDCQTVAVAFQVVLVVGEASVVVPQNLSGAVNYTCVECVTYALAQQLVVTLPESLDADSAGRLEVLWKEIAAFAASIEDVPLSELQARLNAFEAQILEVVRADPGVAEAGTRTNEPGATAPAATPSQTSAPAATDGPTGPQSPSTATEQPQEEPTSTMTSPATATTSTSTSTPTPTATATATATAEPTGTAPAEAQTTAP